MNDCIHVKEKRKEKKKEKRMEIMSNHATSRDVSRISAFLRYLTVVHIDELQNRIGFDQPGKISLPLQEHPRQRNPLAGVLKRFGLTPRGGWNKIFDYKVNNPGRETRLSPVNERRKSVRCYIAVILNSVTVE